MARATRADQVKQVKQIARFLREGPLWASELAGRLGITTRSVNRLLADLRAIGMPLQSVRVGFRMRHWIGERPEKLEKSVSDPALANGSEGKETAEMMDPWDDL